MGLADTLENVAPVPTDYSSNQAQPQYAHQTQSTYNYQSNSSLAPPPSYYPSYGAPPPYGPNAYGSAYNASGSVNQSGIQKNGGAKVGNYSKKSGGVNIKSIGTNEDNLRGQQVQGDVKVGNIGG